MTPEDKLKFKKEFEKKIAGYAKPNFTKNGVDFQITKFSAMEGHKLLDDMRYSVANDFITTEITNESQTAGAFISAILKLPPTKIEEYRIKLFEGIEFKKIKEQKGWLPLSGMEDVAFANAKPTFVYEVMMRSLAVNFLESGQEFLSTLLSAP
jgi:hypothetical protein